MTEKKASVFGRMLILCESNCRLNQLLRFTGFFAIQSIHGSQNGNYQKTMRKNGRISAGINIVTNPDKAVEQAKNPVFFRVGLHDGQSI